MFGDHLKKAVAFLAVSCISCVVVLTLAWVVAPPHDLSLVARPVQARTLQPVPTAIPGSSPSVSDAPASSYPLPVAPQVSPPPSIPSSQQSVHGVPLRGDSEVAEPLMVRVVGDSLTVGAKSFWNSVAQPIATVVSVDARSGRPTREGLQILKSSPLEPGETLVFALGTNDTNRYETFKDLIDDVMAEVGPDNKVVWPTVWRRGALTEINRALWDSMKVYPNLFVIEWTAELIAHPEYIENDDVHYFKAGSEAFVRFIMSRTPRN
jgi:hypothetical protein